MDVSARGELISSIIQKLTPLTKNLHEFAITRPLRNISIAKSIASLFDLLY